MLLELVLVFGFAVPVMLPVTAAAMLLHALAFELCVQHLGSTLMHEARPPVTYLWFSLALGVGLALWMFWECGWAGRLLLSIGMPLTVTVGAAAPELLAHFGRSRSIDVQELKESLLAGADGGQETDVCMQLSPHSDGSEGRRRANTDFSVQLTPQSDESTGRRRANTVFFDFEDESKFAPDH